MLQRGNMKKKIHRSIFQFVSFICVLNIQLIYAASVHDSELSPHTSKLPDMAVEAEPEDVIRMLTSYEGCTLAVEGAFEIYTLHAPYFDFYTDTPDTLVTVSKLVIGQSKSGKIRDKQIFFIQQIQTDRGSALLIESDLSPLRLIYQNKNKIYTRLPQKTQLFILQENVHEKDTVRLRRPLVLTPLASIQEEETQEKKPGDTGFIADQFVFTEELLGYFLTVPTNPSINPILAHKPKEPYVTPTAPLKTNPDGTSHLSLINPNELSSF